MNPADQKDLLRMSENYGIWIMSDLKTPKSTVPICSIGGKLFAMKKDQELSLARFLPTATIVSGPHRADPPEVDWTVANGMCNNSNNFLRLRDEIQELIVDSAYLLLTGRSADVAGSILAQLAHKHGLKPSK
jgi:hypothetical protein